MLLSMRKCVDSNWAICLLFVFIYLLFIYSYSLCEHVTALGRYLGCYKMSLECKTHLIHFYSKCGFNVDAGNNFLVQRFDHSVSSAELSANGTKAEEMGSMKVEYLVEIWFEFIFVFVL
jgi:hypothetical protein